MTRFSRAAAALLSVGIFLIFALAPGVLAEEPKDIVARVGDQVITFSQIDTMINSSAIIGLDIPAYGTPKRNTARLSVLDKMITANLLYLDALRKGVDKNPLYQADVARYAEGTLASLYKEKVLVGEIPVTEEEVQQFFDKNVKEGTELTDDAKLAIEASIRQERFKKRIAGLRTKLRQGISVSIKDLDLHPEGDAKRKGSVVVAAIDNEPVTWGEVKALLSSSSHKDSMGKRNEALNRFIDDRIMVKKAKEAGLDKDPVYEARVNEFKKTRLINMNREEVVAGFSPGDKEIREYFNKNKDKIAVPEVRKIQMVVLKTKEEAEDVKKKIESGEITIFEAARDYSIDPNAKQTLGEMGWVSEGTGFPELSKLTFSLGPGELGGPVKSPAGWHLVKVLDVRDAQYRDIDDKSTWNKTRRMLIHEKLGQYVTNLRKNDYPVEVYEDVFDRIAQDEVNRMSATKKKAGEPEK